jgi:hypothetical protein
MALLTPLWLWRWGFGGTCRIVGSASHVCAFRLSDNHIEDGFTSCFICQYLAHRKAARIRLTRSRTSAWRFSVARAIDRNARMSVVLGDLGMYEVDAVVAAACVRA